MKAGDDGTLDDQADEQPVRATSADGAASASDGRGGRHAREAVAHAGFAIGDTLLGKYRVERVIGAGGMGVVVAARHLQLGAEVALKCISQGALFDENARARFVHEARATARITSDHVVRVLDAGQLEDGAPYLAMELLEGEDLAHVIRERAPIATPFAIDWALQILRGLAAAHDAGVVHRDLKPSNIFVIPRKDGSSHLKLLDFGIAKLPESERNQLAAIVQTAGVLGSPAYMSPEQIRSGSDVDSGTDVWAVGVILFELLTGERPFAGASPQAMLASVVADAPRSLRALRRDVPERLERLVDACLRKDREQRIDAHALAVELTACAGALDAEPSPPIANRSSKPALGRAALAAFVVLAGAAAAAAFYVRAGHDTERPGAMASSPPSAVVREDVPPECISERSGILLVSPTGRSRCSFVSITEALRSAETMTKRPLTIRIQSGRYAVDTSGETFPLEARTDITFEGEGPRATLIDGSGTTSHRSRGGAIVDSKLQATFVVGAPGRRVTFRNLTLRAPEATPEFHRFGVMCDAGDASFVASDAKHDAPEGNVVLENVVVGPGYDTGLVVTTSTEPTPSGCRATVRGGAFVGGWHGIFALGCGAGWGEAPVTLDVDGATSHGVVGFRENEKDGAVLLWGCVSRARIQGAHFTGNSVGVQLDQHAPSKAFPEGYDVTVRSSSFKGQRTPAIKLIRASTIRVLEENRFFGALAPSQGVIVLESREERGSSSILRARKNHFASLPALQIKSEGPYVGRLDFGTAESPGDNIFGCDLAATKATGSQTVVKSLPALSAETIALEGNQWLPAAMGPSEPFVLRAGVVASPGSPVAVRDVRPTSQALPCD